MKNFLLPLLKHQTCSWDFLWCNYDSSFWQILLQIVERVTQDMWCHGTNTNPDACGFMTDRSGTDASMQMCGWSANMLSAATAQRLLQTKDPVKGGSATATEQRKTGSKVSPDFRGLNQWPGSPTQHLSLPGYVSMFSLRSSATRIACVCPCFLSRQI